MGFDAHTSIGAEQDVLTSVGLHGDALPRRKSMLMGVAPVGKGLEHSLEVAGLDEQVEVVKLSTIRIAIGALAQQRALEWHHRETFALEQIEQGVEFGRQEGRGFTPSLQTIVKRVVEFGWQGCRMLAQQRAAKQRQEFVFDGALDERRPIVELVDELRRLPRRMIGAGGLTELAKKREFWRHADPGR